MKKVVLFTGHMIDKSDRAVPRFPEKIAGKVKEIIAGKLAEIREESGRDVSLKGLAGGACGGDILFHEACLELGISSEIILPDAVPEFKAESVVYAGKQWLERFDHLCMKIPHVVLQKDMQIGTLSVSEIEGDKWTVGNRAMLAMAVQQSEGNAALIALWDGASGDGPGGTQHMISLAESMGLTIVIIPVNTLV